MNYESDVEGSSVNFVPIYDQNAAKHFAFFGVSFAETSIVSLCVPQKGEGGALDQSIRTRGASASYQVPTYWIKTKTKTGWRIS